MDVALLLVKQIVIMFLYMACGFLLFKGKKITKEGSASMANLLVWLIIPVVLVKSFCVEPTADRVQALALSVLLAVVALALSIGLSAFVFRNHPIENIAAAFSNAGFIGIPLVTATVGGQYVFFIAFFVAMLNILQWIYGTAVITSSKMRFNKATLCHPLILSVGVGLVLFFTGWGVKLPAVVHSTMNGISAVNSPIAMFVMGVYLAQADLKNLLKNKWLYLVSVVRLLAAPVLTLLAFWGLQAILPAMEKNMLMALFITAVAPAGANVAVYAQLYNKDYVYASTTVVVSTLLCLATMPLMVLAAQYLF